LDLRELKWKLRDTKSRHQRGERERDTKVGGGAYLMAKSMGG